MTAELKSCKTVMNEMALTLILDQLDCDTACRTIRQGTKRWQWLSIMPSMLNGTELSVQEFRDALLLCYAARSPRDPSSHCDGCGAAFSVHHALECKIGGLIILYDITRSPKNCAAWHSSKALMPSAIHLAAITCCN
jgi:hypothetical protein